jgi:DNA-binding CsgD family transcriptional regulator
MGIGTVGQIRAGSLRSRSYGWIGFLAALSLALFGIAADDWRSAEQSTTTAENRAAPIDARCAGCPLLESARDARSWPLAEQLTPKERVVAVLAAAGKSNALIAHELGIGRRTVETHLQHIYRKVDVSSRHELSVLVWRQRDPDA